jgi:hypothetical protein
MSLFKIKNPVEYSFIQMMHNFPDTGHWQDKRRFYAFVKTVCRHNAVKWKDVRFLKKRILEIRPYVDAHCLEYLLTLYYELLEFYKVPPISSQYQRFDNTIKHGHYLEIKAKNGVLSEKEIPIK